MVFDFSKYNLGNKVEPIIITPNTPILVYVDEGSFVLRIYITSSNGKVIREILPKNSTEVKRILEDIDTAMSVTRFTHPECFI